MNQNVIISKKSNTGENGLIKKKLMNIIATQKIPHLIFHGSLQSKKREILHFFLQNIYRYDQRMMKKYILYVNCSHNKGIGYIRDELKFFAKTNINTNKGRVFKSIVLFNADMLTIDAQSALRRCIEQFSNTTRFFILIENMDKLLKPIVSRFCSIFVPDPPNIVDKNTRYELYLKQRKQWLSKNINIKEIDYDFNHKCVELTNKLYDKGYSAIDLVQYLAKMKMDQEKKYVYLLFLSRSSKEFRSEKMFMFFILYLIHLRPPLKLENISTM